MYRNETSRGWRQECDACRSVAWQRWTILVPSHSMPGPQERRSMSAQEKSVAGHRLATASLVAKTRAMGRPRDQRIDREVVAAVLAALRERGYRAVTIDGIARKVKRARTSLYRRWPSKRHLVAYAVVSEMGDNPAADTGRLREDLEAAVQTLLNAFAGPLGRALAGLVADMAQD